ncbi:hypothetical protein [Clostridium sp. CTA-7]
MDNSKTQLEVFYNSSLDVQNSNKIFNDLKIFFYRELKSKIFWRSLFL